MTHPVIPSIRTLLYENGLLPLRSQAELSENLLQERLDLLPSLLEETQLDCWLVVAHENNEDPVMKSLMTWDRRTARRLTALLFFRNGRGGANAVGYTNYPDNLIRAFVLHALQARGREPLPGARAPV